MKGNLFVFNHKPKFINFTQINIHLSKHHKLPNKHAHEPYLGLVKIYKYVKPPPPHLFLHVYGNVSKFTRYLTHIPFNQICT